MFDKIHDWGFAVLLLGEVFPRIVAQEGPDFLNINGRTEFLQAGLFHVEIPHTNFAEVTGMALGKR